MARPSGVAATARLVAQLRHPGHIFLVSALSVVVYLIAANTPVRSWFSDHEVATGLSLLAVATGMVTALSCGVLGQLYDDPLALRLGPGLAFYSLLGIPAATVNAGSDDANAAVGNVRLFAHAMLVLLTFLAARAMVRPKGDGWLALVVGLAAAAGLAALGVAFPHASLAFTTSTAVRLVLSAAWVTSAAYLLVMQRLHRRHPWHSWAGWGLLVIALAHVGRVAVGSPLLPFGPKFLSLRFFGLMLLLVGVVPATRQAFARLSSIRAAERDMLDEAHVRLRKVAERDHELRNGLYGLTGVTDLLEAGHRRDEADIGLLREAVASELSRLHVLLRPTAADADDECVPDYDVAPVLRRQAALHAGPGVDVRVDVEPGLRVRGNPTVLAQVITNLLVNCMRHAPGSPVRILAVRHQDTVVVRVCDFGPGVPPGSGESAFEMGSRGARSTGQGLGLHICRELISAESGRIYLRPRPVGGAGCTVVVELPIAPADRDSGPEVGEPVEAARTR